MVCGVMACGTSYVYCICNNKGRMYHVILNLYNDIKSRIVYKDYVSNFFSCINGVRHAEHISISFFARTISK